MSKSLDDFMSHALTMKSPHVKAMESADPDHDGDNDVSDLITQLLQEKLDPDVANAGAAFATKLVLA